MQKEHNPTYLFTYIDMAKIKTPFTTESLKHVKIYNCPKNISAYT